MKGKVLIPFATLRATYQIGEVIEITDWSQVNGHLVEPIVEPEPPETMTIEPAEQAVAVPTKGRKRHAA